MITESQLPNTISLLIRYYPVYFAFFLLWGAIFRLNNTIGMSLFLATVLSIMSIWNNRPTQLSLPRSDNDLAMLKFALANRYSLSYESERQLYFRPSSLLWQFIEVSIVIKIEPDWIIIYGGTRRLEKLRSQIYQSSALG